MCQSMYLCQSHLGAASAANVYDGARSTRSPLRENSDSKLRRSSVTITHEHLIVGGRRNEYH